MKSIELLTVESYLESRIELIENVNYTLEELDSDERFEEIIKEIKNEYFEKEVKQKQVGCAEIVIKQNGYYVEYNGGSQCFSAEDKFCTKLKKEYHQLIEEKKESEIVDNIGLCISAVFIGSCDLTAYSRSRIYEIIKYTLSGERRCDYYKNGRYMQEMEEDDIYPFEKQGDQLPIYCQELQRVLFGVHRKIFVNPQKVKSEDITRYSFYKTQKIYNKVTKALGKKEGKHSGYYIEGEEDYILLDRILGISLTNIIYWKTKEITERETQDSIIRVMRVLAKCHYSFGRNLVAQILLDYLGATGYNKEIMDMVEKLIKEKVRIWNEYYGEIEAILLCPMFNKFLKEELSPNDYIEICNHYEEYYSTWKEYMYMDEIAKEDGMLSDKKIRIPVRDMNNQTWYAYIHKAVFETIWST